MADNSFKIDFEDRENPVAGSAADVAKRKSDAEKKVFLAKNKTAFETAAENFPAFGRILELMNIKDE